MECNLVGNNTRDFKIGWARSASSIWNLKYDFETKTERQEVQLPLYYSRFKIAEFSQYHCLVDLVANLLKSDTKRLFSTSHFVFVTEMMWYRAKMVRFRTEMMIVIENMDDAI